MWTGEDVADANGPESGQIKSKLDHVISVGGANLDFLAEIANEIEARKVNYVAAFFQLPYPVAVDAGWYELPGLTEGVYPEFRFEVCRLVLTHSWQFRLEQYSPSSDGREPLVTQVAALFPVWGIRAHFHDRYLDHVDHRHDRNPVLVPQKSSWIDNRPIFLRDYEINFANRLIREIDFPLRHFLSAYSILSFREARVPKQPYAYCSMLAPGFLVYAGDFVPIQHSLYSNVVDGTPPTSIDRRRMHSALSITHREIGRFEAQILALERLRLQGEPALALVGTLSLLEWLLDSYIQRHGGTADNLYEASRHRFIDFLSAEELGLIDKARKARNKAVHEAPPLRRSIKTPHDRSGQELDGMPSPMTSDEVHAIIRLVFDVFRRINQLASRQGA